MVSAVCMCGGFDVAQVDQIVIWLSDTEKMQRYVNEEKNIREENLRLQRKLQLEVERREALCRHLSESESR
jgi:hypothetical protein